MTEAYFLLYIPYPDQYFDFHHDRENVLWNFFPKRKKD